MIEEKILNYNGVDYIVSSDGRIYSTKNVGRGKYHAEISQRKNKDGYLQVTVGNKKNRTQARVHRMVALAFIENPDNLLEVDHIDNDRENNCVENLQWIDGADNKKKTPFETRSESHKWEKNGRSKLTIEDVKMIRYLFENGHTKQEIAHMYGRGWSTIHNIVKNQTWRF